MNSVSDVASIRTSNGNLPSKELLERLTLYEQLMKAYDDRFLPWWRQFAKLISVIGILATLVGGLGVAYITSTFSEKVLIKKNAALTEEKAALTQEVNSLRNQLATAQQTVAALKQESQRYSDQLRSAKNEVSTLNHKLQRSAVKMALLQKQIDILNELGAMAAAGE